MSKKVAEKMFTDLTKGQDVLEGCTALLEELR